MIKRRRRDSAEDASSAGTEAGRQIDASTLRSDAIMKDVELFLATGSEEYDFGPFIEACIDGLKTSYTNAAAGASDMTKQTTPRLAGDKTHTDNMASSVFEDFAIHDNPADATPSANVKRPRIAAEPPASGDGNFGTSSGPITVRFSTTERIEEADRLLRKTRRSFWGLVENREDRETVKTIAQLAAKTWDLSSENEGTIAPNTTISAWSGKLKADFEKACEEAGFHVTVIRSMGQVAHELYRGRVEQGSTRAQVVVPILAERNAVLKKLSEPPMEGEELWPYWNKGVLNRDLQ